MVSKAEGGHLPSQIALFQNYYDKEDRTADNTDKATYWLQKILDGDSASGHWFIADHYSHFMKDKKFLKLNYEKALSHYNAAYEKFNAEDKNEEATAIKFFIGLSMKKLGQEEEGQALIREAADAGDYRASAMLKSEK